MKNKVIGAMLLVLSFVLVLFFHGTILSSKLGVPPLAKIFNPFHGFWSPSDTQDELTLSGESGDINILIDKRGVPHIYAETLEDALKGQGYIEARDRTFQMQFLRQVATGQLSEYFGDRTLSFDKWTHKKGIPTAVKTATEAWSADPEVRKNYQAYIDGANAYLGQLNYSNFPVEMKLLDLTPKAWDMEAAVSVFKYMGNNLAGGNNDIENTNVRILLGNENYEKYYKEKEASDEPIIPEEVTYDFEEIVNDGVKPDQLYDKPIYNAYYEKRNKNVGSNNWALNGSKTASGAPILCSDPHLSLSVPSIWYEVNIITPEHNVYGVSFPGLPGIMIGWNKHMSWAETNVGHDVQDLYHINYTDESRQYYWLDGNKMPIEIRLDKIKMKDGSVVTDTNYITHWGPIIKRSNDGKSDIAMDWLVARPAPASEGNTFVNSMLSKNYDEFLEASSTFVTPAQNFLYADRKDIGLRVNGLLPARTEGDGRQVSEGDSSRYGWNYWIPREQNPQAKNPQQNYLTSSNQRSAHADYPYYYTGRFERYRNRAINDHLDTVSKVTIAEMMTFQNNNLSKKASDFLPLFLAALEGVTMSDKEEEILSTLKKWDYTYEVNTPAPTYFQKWFRQVQNNTWDEIAEYRDTMAVTYPLSTVLRDLIRASPKDDMFDKLHTIKKETAEHVIRESYEAMVEAVTDLTEEERLWGHSNKVNVPHLARLPGFGSGPLFAPGCGDAINATRGTFGPSWRMVVSLTDKVEAYGIYPGGQSGDPRSGQYMNMMEKWRTGKYDTIIYDVPKSEILKR